MADPRLLRFLAFYLPQFHPIPENDEWWGTGFTEWTSVVKARPLLRGHYQPHLPADLGFYDLRLPEARAAQAALARAHGIHGFCYYHYWFEGRRLLERPFDEVLRSGQPDFPFCLCWANENWTRAWTGKLDQPLLVQGYSHQDDLDHVRWLAEAFADPRYVRVGGRPLFLVYRARHLPEPARTVETWRHESQRLGVAEPYVCAVETGLAEGQDAHELGFDATVEFPPFSVLGTPVGGGRFRRGVRRLARPNSPYRRNRMYEYRDLVDRDLSHAAPGGKRYPAVTPSFDNSPRRPRGDAVVVLRSTPDEYERWLRGAVARFEPYSSDENLFFVNAWNEWAEGNHLEPCQRWGNGYLQAHARACDTGNVPEAPSERGDHQAATGAGPRGAVGRPH